MIPQDLHPDVTVNIDELDDEDYLSTASNPNPSATSSNNGRDESNVRDVMDTGEYEQITKTMTNTTVPPVPTVWWSERVPKPSAAGASL